MEKKDSYIEENRGFITASKLKCFMNSPEDFFLKYIKEEESLDTRDKKHFTIGTAIDDLISYGENEFHKKYFIDEGLKKAELEEKLNDLGIDCAGMKVDDLKIALYGDISEKIRLTALAGREILAYYTEFKRQKLAEMDGEYECQKTFIGTYRTLKLKGTLDRFLLLEKEDKDGIGVKLRDTKTTKSLESFKWTWDKELGYDISMSFYWVLVFCATGKKSRLIFDTIQKTFPYISRTFEIPQGRILEIVDTIKDALNRLDACMIAYEETGNEIVWKVRVPYENLLKCDMYPIMETAIQTEIELLQ